MPSLLFVSISFPPKNDPECLQAARYFKYLVQQKSFHIDVVTSARPTLFMPEDKSLLPYLAGHRQLLELPVWETKWSNFALRKVGLDSVLFPDSKMTFHWQWKKVIRSLQHKPDIIYSRSNPISSAFMATQLKNFYQVPWVMHMSDPWMISPLKKNAGEKERQREYELIKNADAITFTTPATRNLYSTHYPDLQHRFTILPNVYDPEDRIEFQPVQNPKFRIVYTGGLTEARSLSFLAAVLEKIELQDPNLLAQLEIRVAGPRDRFNRRFFESNRFACMQHLGELTYQDALQLQRQAHYLMVVDSPTSAVDAVFFPSKLLDYFLTGLPIMAITPQNSTTREILKDYMSNCFVHSDVDGLTRFLVHCIKDRGKETQQPRAPLPEKFSAKFNAVLLNELLYNLLKNKKP